MKYPHRRRERRGTYHARKTDIRNSMSARHAIRPLQFSMGSRFAPRRIQMRGLEVHVLVNFGRGPMFSLTTRPATQPA